MSQVQTGVDDLMKLVEKEEHISLSDAAKKLQMPESTLQAWVDFLVEDHILGIEYKFTTPYIYVNNKERLSKVNQQEDTLSIEDFKNGFYARARDKELPEERIPSLWKEHLQYVVEQQKKFFLQECQRRSVPEAEDLYGRYVEEITSEL